MVFEHVTTNKRPGGQSMVKRRITPFLWFDHQAEEAANFYVAIFKNSKIHGIARYDDEASRASGRPRARS
jgi:predicted 3-demethylubiquinone-9 3-methyltransferase (glyoxalase superfamily)